MVYQNSGVTKSHKKQKALNFSIEGFCGPAPQRVGEPVCGIRTRPQLVGDDRAAKYYFEK
jgi:hypothetical protein